MKPLVDAIPFVGGVQVANVDFFNIYALSLVSNYIFPFLRSKLGIE